MAQRSGRLRYAVVFLLGLASLVTWLPDLRRDFGHPLGNAGLDINYKGVVTRAQPRAAAAGVSAGDRIDLAGTTTAERSAAIFANTVDPGSEVFVPLMSHGRHYTARIVTAAEIPNVPVIVLRQLGALLLLVLGAFLVLKRPNRATWAFFIFSTSGGAPVNDFVLLGPSWWLPIGMAWSLIFQWATPFFGAVFALHLLYEGPLPAWRGRLEFLTYAVMLGTVACGSAAVLLIYFGVNWWQGAVIASALTLLAFVSIPAILMATYAESDVATRERLRWVLCAFSIAALAAVADVLGAQGNLGLYPTTYFEHSLLTLTYSILPAVAVLYTILKHRIIDVNVAISRAAVYAAISALVVGVFAMVDLFFSKALSEGRVGLIADMGLALILGFSFNAFHARVDRFMDWMFFRARHRAEEHIAAVASAIPYARTQEHVNRLLIDEPVRAFGLAEGVLVQVPPAGALQFVHRAGQQEDDTLTGDPDSLVAMLRAQRKPWRLVEEHMALAVPIFSDAELEAIAFYAPHLNGTDIDNDELALIERAAAAAGGAYARFKAAALRDRVAELEAALQAAVAAS